MTLLTKKLEDGRITILVFHDNDGNLKNLFAGHPTGKVDRYREIVGFPEYYENNEGFKRLEKEDVKDELNIVMISMIEWAYKELQGVYPRQTEDLYNEYISPMFENVFETGKCVSYMKHKSEHFEYLVDYKVVDYKYDRTWDDIELKLLDMYNVERWVSMVDVGVNP